jgi:oligoendopeptidase F
MDICLKHGLVFQDYLIYRGDGSVDILGELDLNVSPCISFYEARKKRTSDSVSFKTNKKSATSSSQKLQDLNNRIDDLSNEAKAKAKELRSKSAEVAKLKSIRKPLVPGEERQKMYRLLKKKKNERNLMQSQLATIKNSLKNSKSKKYEMLTEKVCCSP